MTITARTKATRSAASGRAARDPARKCTVLVVDDSAVVRQVLTAVLQRDKSIQVIGAVADPLFALQRMKMDWPDVIVLDVEMPRMDGITFLKRIMVEHPTPVVICSSLTTKGAETTMQALAAGALAIVTKPKIGVRDYLADPTTDLVEVVKAAAYANVSNIALGAEPLAARVKQGLPVQAHGALSETTDRIVAIGTSTGGTQALEAVLSSLPRVSPGIVVVQHMPEKFTTAFAERLNSISEIEVREAHDGDRVILGCAYIAPGGRHMRVKRSGAQYVIDVRDGPPVNRHKPSVDVLFHSVAEFVGKNALGIIMTGMGGDGALGLQAMHAVGATTVAQDEKTSVVFGMPKEAIELGCVDRVRPLQSIAQEIRTFGAG